MACLFITSSLTRRPMRTSSWSHQKDLDISFVMSMYAELVFPACSRLIRIRPGQLKQLAWLTLQPSGAAALELSKQLFAKRRKLTCSANRLFSVADSRHSLRPDLRLLSRRDTRLRWPTSSAYTK